MSYLLLEQFGVIFPCLIFSDLFPSLQVLNYLVLSLWCFAILVTEVQICRLLRLSLFMNNNKHHKVSSQSITKCQLCAFW